MVALALLPCGCGDGTSELPQLSIRPSPVGTLQALRSQTSLERIVDLPGSPMGLASGDGVLLMANRYDPWGFLRLRPLGGDAFEADKLALVESIYQQPLAFDAVAWNGSAWVALTDGAYLDRPDTEWFLILDAADLHLVQAVQAPPLLGCLAWDGTGYWAATRKQTESAPDTAWVYRLDSDLEVLSRSPSPGPGCQGMTFDGDFLWMADVFDDVLYALDVWGAEPRLVRAADPGVAYLSGVEAWDGSLWIVEYGDDRMGRVAESVRLGAPSGSRR